MDDHWRWETGKNIGAERNGKQRDSDHRHLSNNLDVYGRDPVAWSSILCRLFTVQKRLSRFYLLMSLKEIKPFFVYIFYLFFLSLSSTVEVDLQ